MVAGVVSKTTLPQRFKNLTNQLGASEQQSAEAWAVIEAAYNESHRAYHNLTHLEQVFAQLDRVCKASPAMQCAVWYHDVIYKPGSKSNEDKSAVLAQKTLRSWQVDEATITRTVQLIEATKSHQCDENGY